MGKAPLRLVIRRNPVVWKELLECGHEFHAHLEFLWDENAHLITFEPSAKRRRCRLCQAGESALPYSPETLPGSSPKKPVASAKSQKERAA